MLESIVRWYRHAVRTGSSDRGRGMPRKLPWTPLGPQSPPIVPRLREAGTLAPGIGTATGAGDPR
jgi:hypothetical protein